MKFNYKKGFTLIELLVVIAIIGILSSIVLASLNSARDKGSNAKIKANMHGIRSQADVVYDNNSQDYTNVCSDTNIINAISSAIIAGGDTGTVVTRCNSNTSAWAANVLLKTPDSGNPYWCVDSTGEAKSEPVELAGGFVCI